MEDPVTGWCVVTHLSPGECDLYPGRDCVQSVVVGPDGTPFASKAEADAEAAKWPEWSSPHTMTFTTAWLGRLRAPVSGPGGEPA